MLKPGGCAGFDNGASPDRPEDARHARPTGREREDLGGHPTFRTSEALFLVDQDLRIVAWNAGAAALTGIPAHEALGRPCYSVFAVRDEEGRLLCGADCALARRAFAGHAIPPCEALVEREGDLRHVVLHLVGVEAADRPFLMHLVAEVHAAPADEQEPAQVVAEGAPALTRRQQEILAFLCDGIPVRQIGRRLGLSEVTVRNHVRGILGRLECHSQLEAVAKARRIGLIGPGAAPGPRSSH